MYQVNKVVRFVVGLFPAPCSDLDLIDTGQIWTQLDTRIDSCCRVCLEQELYLPVPIGMKSCYRAKT